MKLTQKLILVLFCFMLTFSFGCSKSPKASASAKATTTSSKTATASIKSSNATSTSTLAPTGAAIATNSSASPLVTADANKPSVIISRGKTYEASSVWPVVGYETDKAFDDDVTTRWSAIVEPECWISIDFGGDYNITSFTMIEDKEWCLVGDYTVQAFVGNEWKDVYTSESLEIEDGAMVNINMVKASKLKFLFNTQLKTTSTFFDISVFGYK